MRFTCLVLPIVTLVAGVAAGTQAEPQIPAAAGPEALLKRPLTIEDYYQLQTVGNPSFSPNSRWVSFSVSTRVEEDNDTCASMA